MLNDEQRRLIERAKAFIDFRWGPEDLVEGLRAMLNAAREQQDYLDTLTAVLNAIGYTEEFAAQHLDLKVIEGVKLFLALQNGAVECGAHIGPDCTECGGTGVWTGEQQADHVLVPRELLQDLIDDVEEYAASREFKAREVVWRNERIVQAREILSAVSEQKGECMHDWKLSMTHRDGNSPWVCAKCGIHEQQAARCMTEEDVERQYRDGIHIGSGLPRESCPCGLCSKHRFGFNRAAKGDGHADK